MSNLILKAKECKMMELMVVGQGKSDEIPPLMFIVVLPLRFI